MKKAHRQSLSPKKTDAVDISERMIISMEFSTKMLEQDSKTLDDQLKALAASIQKMEEMIAAGGTVSKAELSKKYSDSQALISKINKEIEKNQAQLHKAQLEFEKNLLIPFTDGKFQSLTSSEREQISLNINKIKDIFAQNKKSLETSIDRVLDYTKRLAVLETPINEICFSDLIEEALKLNKKLDERLTAICESPPTVFSSARSSTSTISSKQCDPENNKAKLLQLYQLHQKGHDALERAKAQLESVEEKLGSLSLKD